MQIITFYGNLLYEKNSWTNKFNETQDTNISMLNDNLSSVYQIM